MVVAFQDAIKAVLQERRVLLPGLLLLVVVITDWFFLQPLFSELDILEHFLFGFVLSEASSVAAKAASLSGVLGRKLGNWSGLHIDLLVRLSGFFLTGVLIWEGAEYFVFPVFGAERSSFFGVPLTLNTVDGSVDVAAGVLGSLISWFTVHKRGQVDRFRS
jgi:hypothetical protein